MAKQQTAPAKTDDTDDEPDFSAPGTEYYRVLKTGHFVEDVDGVATDVKMYTGSFVPARLVDAFSAHGKDVCLRSGQLVAWVGPLPTDAITFDAVRDEQELRAMEEAEALEAQKAAV